MTRAVGAGVFASLFVAGVALELHARRPHRRHATLSQVVDRIGARLPGRLLLFGGWAFAGWHFFVR